MTDPKPSFKPSCPNHGAFLEGCGFPLPAKGTGRCPISGYTFEFEADVDDTAVVQDKEGNLTKKPKWEIKGDDSKAT